MSPTFNFDQLIDRCHTDSIKWHRYADRNIIPMWVADMDFLSPPTIMEALHQRIDHGVFGYATPRKALLETVVAHLKTTYNWSIDPEWIVWLPGLVSGLNIACRSMGKPGSGILTTVPVYPPFLTAPKLAGKTLGTSAMVYDQHQWQIDFDDLKTNHNPGTTLFILCNPHNPTGRMFTRQELDALADICLRNNWLICSDEIHCDLILEPGLKHLPMASLDPEISARTITLMAPSKTYNIPGLGCALAIISNAGLRRRFQQTMAGIVPHVNLLGFSAALAAYTHGRPWLEQLLNYLRNNRDFVYKSIAAMPGLSMAPVEATYLAWIDTRATGINNPTALFESAGVGLSNGHDFRGPGFVRLNFGCPRALLHKAMERMATALEHRQNL